MWYIYTMEYYSAIKRNKIVSFVDTWMDLETVIQSEVSQKDVDMWMDLETVIPSEVSEKDVDMWI